MDFEDICELIGQPLVEKEKISREMIRKSLAGTKAPAVCFSGGKKSTVLLHLVKQSRSVPLYVLRVNTTLDHENLGQYCQKMKRLWSLDLIEVQPDNVDPAIASAGAECCKRRIWEPLKKALKENHVDCALLGITHDSRSRFNRDVTGDEESVDHVYPLFHFTEADVRDYVKKYNLSCCSLYDQGIANVDCRPCTMAVAAKAADKGEEEKVREKLRKLGYL